VPEYEPGPRGDYTDWEDTEREIEERRWKEEQDIPEDVYNPDPDADVEVPE
jgi:hypothetical protein